MRYLAIPTQTARAIRQGAPDANGHHAENLGPSADHGAPCRYCLAQVPKGQPVLLFALRPFLTLQPYSECGPAFICAGDCASGSGTDLPRAILTAPAYILRGYGPTERIIPDTGAVIPTNEIEARCAELFARPEIRFIHIRSASNNCYLLRVERD